MLSIENQMYMAKQHPESYFSNELSDRKNSKCFKMLFPMLIQCMLQQSRVICICTKKKNNKFSRIRNNLKIIKPWIISSISLLTIKVISSKIAQNA